MFDLKPCPFCGQELEQRHRRYNPYARCATDDCMSGKLPLISLDVPDDIERWNRRTPPAGMALVPREITAETGHKAGMIGDFHEEVGMQCPECEGSESGCDICGGSGEYVMRVSVSWTTIKAIHRRIVEIAEAEKAGRKG